MFPNPLHTKYLVPESEISNRIKGLQQELQRQNIGLAWIQHPADLFYFSGSIQDGILLIPAESEPVYYVKISKKRAEAESPLQIEAFPGRKGLVNRAKEMAKQPCIGLSLDVTRAIVYTLITKLWPEARINDTSWTLKILKSIKSKWEIKQIKGATAQASALMQQLPKIIKVGMTELKAAALLEKYLRESGHPGIMRIRGAAETHSCLQFSAGDSANYPTNFNGPLGSIGLYPAAGTGPTENKIRPGQTIMLDFVTSFNGYHADFSRTYFAGNEVPDNILAAHQYCLDVLEQLEKLLVPGNNCQEIYKQVLARALTAGTPEGFMGYGENQVRFFAHGIGTELDEMPVIADRVDLKLKAGMVLAVEPKAFLTGIGAVGAEDTYVIETDGPVSLLDINREIIKLK